MTIVNLPISPATRDMIGVRIPFIKNNGRENGVSKRSAVGLESTKRALAELEIKQIMKNMSIALSNVYSRLQKEVQNLEKCSGVPNVKNSFTLCELFELSRLLAVVKSFRNVKSFSIGLDETITEKLDNLVNGYIWRLQARELLDGIEGRKEDINSQVIRNIERFVRSAPARVFADRQRHCQQQGCMQAKQQQEQQALGGEERMFSMKETAITSEVSKPPEKLSAREIAYMNAKELLKNTNFPIHPTAGKTQHKLKLINPGSLLGIKGPNADRYHNPKFLYPVGFHSKRIFDSVKNPEKQCEYSSLILKGDKGPLFRLVHEGGSPRWDAHSPSRCWMDMLVDLNDARAKHKIQRRGTNLYGVEMYGIKQFMKYLEGVDGALDCEHYVFECNRTGKRLPACFAGKTNKPVVEQPCSSSRPTFIFHALTDTTKYSCAVLNLINRMKRISGEWRFEQKYKGISSQKRKSEPNAIGTSSQKRKNEPTAIAKHRPTKKPRLMKRVNKARVYAEVVACEKIRPKMRWRETNFKILGESLYQTNLKFNTLLKDLNGKCNVDLLVSKTLGANWRNPNSRKLVPLAFSNAPLRCMSVNGGEENIYRQIQHIYSETLSIKPQELFESSECNCSHPSHAPKFTMSINANGEIVGAITCAVFSSEFIQNAAEKLKPTILEVEALAVKKEKQGMGFGMLLLVLLRILAHDMQARFGNEVTILAKGSPKAQQWWCKANNGFVMSMRELLRMKLSCVSERVKEAYKEITSFSQHLHMAFDHKDRSVIWVSSLDSQKECHKQLKSVIERNTREI